MLAFALVVLFVGVGGMTLTVLADSGLRASHAVRRLRAELQMSDQPAATHMRLRAVPSLKRAVPVRRPAVCVLRAAA